VVNPNIKTAFSKAAWNIGPYPAEAADSFGASLPPAFFVTIKSSSRALVAEARASTRWSKHQMRV